MKQQKKKVKKRKLRLTNTTLPKSKHQRVNNIRDLSTWGNAEYMCMRCGLLLTTRCCPNCDS